MQYFLMPIGNVQIEIYFNRNLINVFELRGGEVVAEVS